MKVLFLYVSTNMSRDGELWFYDEGVASAVSILRERGHDFAFRMVGHRDTLDDVVPWVREQAGDAPALVTFLTSVHFSAYAHDIPDTFLNVQGVKAATGLPTMFAGLWATLRAEALLEQDGIDMVGRGELDHALADVCDALERGEMPTEVPNVWTRTDDGSVHRPALRPLLPDLDALPFPARDILPVEAHANERDGILTVLGSRGCPMGCEFCTHVVVRKAYNATPGQYMRNKSVDYVFREIAQARERVPGIWAIYFHDDMFLLQPEWRKEFFARYADEVGLPFGCNLIIEQINETICKELSEAGCSHVMVGIESGSEYMRTEVFDKPLSDARIMEALALCQDHGMHVKFYALLGAPEETRPFMVESFKGFAKYCADMIQVQVWMAHETSDLMELDREAAETARRQYDPQGHRDAWRLKFYFHFFHRFVALYHLLGNEKKARWRARIARAFVTASVRLPWAPELLLTRDWDGRRRWPSWFRFLKPVAIALLGGLGRRLRAELGPLERRLAADYLRPEGAPTPEVGWHGPARLDRRLQDARQPEPAAVAAS